MVKRERVGTRGMRLLMVDRVNRNALSLEMIECLIDGLQVAAVDKEVCYVLLASQMEVFSSGLHLGELQTHGSEVMVGRLADLYRSIFAHPVPVIAEVEGVAVGGGAGLVLAADHIVTTVDGQLRFPEIKLGVLPALVAVLLSRVLPEHHVFRVLATGGSLSLTLAEFSGIRDIGRPSAEPDTPHLIHEVPERAIELGERFSTGNRFAVSELKRLVRRPVEFSQQVDQALRGAVQVSLHSR